MKKFSNIIYFIVLTIFTIQFSLIISFSYFINRNINSYLLQIRKNEEDSAINFLKSKINFAYDIYKFSYRNNTPENALEFANSIIKDIRYHKTNYIWVHKITGKNNNGAFMLVHPDNKIRNKELKGLIDLNRIKYIHYNGKSYEKNSNEVKHIKGTDIFVQFNKISLTKGEGVVSYFWPKIINGKATEVGYKKLSYVKYFPELNIVIGTGLYADYIDNIEQKKFQQIKYVYKSILINLVIIGGLITFVLLIVTIIYLKKLYDSQLNDLNKEIHERKITENLLIKKENDLADLNQNLEERVEKRTSELLIANSKMKELNQKLCDNQEKLIHSEKMASLGQLAAGVAHEINNPIGFIVSNISTLKNYMNVLINLISQYEDLLVKAKALKNSDIDNCIAKIEKLKKIEDFDFITDDIDMLINETNEGTQRVKEIVIGLKNYSHVDEDIINEIDINECIKISKKMVWNELKYHCEIIEDLHQCPKIQINAGKLNQVIMNLLVNAGHAIKDKGIINIKTRHITDKIHLIISDNGEGIPEENIKKIFDPFYTSKPVGKGTGLGLAVSSKIINEFGGEIVVESEYGSGTTFTIILPLNPIQL